MLISAYVPKSANCPWGTGFGRCFRRRTSWASSSSATTSPLVVALAGAEELNRGLVRTMAEMRRIVATGEPPGPRWVGAKCRACGYYPLCWDSEARPDNLEWVESAGRS